MSKLIFFCISWFIGVQTMGGPEIDNIISSANNEPIFVIVVSILGFLKTTNPLMTFSN